MSREALEPHFLRTIVKDNKEYCERLDKEFSLIDSFGFTKVFLQVQIIIEILRQKKIPHIIRGSAGCSLVCFLLGITEIDPILYKLELARFMNAGRKDLPDIDIDVPYNRREELYNAVEEQWKKKVARISNHVHYGKKTALRESVKEILLQQEPSSQRTQSLKKLNRRDFVIAKLLTPEEQHVAQENAKKKAGTVKYNSLHCGGIVIFEDEEEVPAELLLENYQKHE